MMVNPPTATAKILAGSSSRSSNHFWRLTGPSFSKKVAN